MISARPITSRIVSRFRANSLLNSAEQSIQLGDGVEWLTEPPVMLPDEPDRIRGHHADSNPARNIEHLNGRVIRQGPTRMHLLRDVLIAEGNVLAASSYDRIAPGRRKLLLTGKPQLLDEAVLCSTYVDQKYFGHWLKDGLAHEQLAADAGHQAIVLDREPWFHEAGYRDLVSLHPVRSNFARCDRLWVLEDHEFNQHFADRYNRIRERLRDRVGAPERGTDRVFIARGDAGVGRILANRMEVRAELARRGFIILQPGASDAREIASTLARARLVVSPEGSALAHAAIAMPRGSGLLTILGAQHLNLNYKPLSDALGFRFGLTIADAVNDDDFSLPIDRLLRAIDLMESVLGRSAA